MCTHDNFEWLSGEENLRIALNGNAIVKCTDCGAIGYNGEEDNV